MMDFERLTNGVKDVMTVRQVYGDPYERGDIAIIPVATVIGGGGGGNGTQNDINGSEQSGSGGGLGFVACPTGAYVVKGGDVEWRPVVNVNLIIAGIHLLLFVALLGRKRGRRKS